MILCTTFYVHGLQLCFVASASAFCRVSAVSTVSTITYVCVVGFVAGPANFYLYLKHSHYTTLQILLTFKTLADVYCPVHSTYWAGPREVVGFVVGPAHDRRSLVSMAYQEFLSLPHDHRDSWSYDHHYQQ